MQKLFSSLTLCLLATFLMSCAGGSVKKQLPIGLTIASNACDNNKNQDCYEEDSYDYEKDFAEIPLLLESEKISDEPSASETVQVSIPKSKQVIESKKVDIEIIKKYPTIKERYNISVEINDIATERTIDKLNNPEKYIAKKKSSEIKQTSQETQISETKQSLPVLPTETKKTDEVKIAEKKTEPEVKVKKQKKASLTKSKLESDFFLEEVEFSSLVNLEKDNVKSAFDTFLKSCTQFAKDGNDWIKSNHIAIDKSHMMEICTDANSTKSELSKYKKSEQKNMLEGFFVRWFSPYKVFSKGKDTGTFTGYYEAHIKGSTTATCDYLYPIYGTPDNPKFQNMTREEIENGAIRGKAKILFWAKSPVDIFITQIQGSGVIETDDGKQYRIGYAGNNGYNFTGTGEAMRQIGVRPDNGLSMNSVRDYMKKNPKIAKQIMNKNKRFIFFKENDKDGAIGTLGTTLTPRRTIAVDAEYIPLGLPMYVNVSDPDGKSLDRMVIAADTGTAIKGGIRADFFFGFGEEALKTAGRMKQNGKYFIFLPKNRDKFMVKSDNIHCLN